LHDKRKTKNKCTTIGLAKYGLDITQHQLFFPIALQSSGRRNSSQQKFLSQTLNKKMNNGSGQTDGMLLSAIRQA